MTLSSRLSPPYHRTGGSPDGPKAIVALATLHSAAVLYHHHVLRDEVLGRMLLEGDDF